MNHTYATVQKCNLSLTLVIKGLNESVSYFEAKSSHFAILIYYF